MMIEGVPGSNARDQSRARSETMQQLVHLVYYQGMKYREAAEILNIPVGTVKSGMHAAMLKLSEGCQDTHTQRN